MNVHGIHIILHLDMMTPTEKRTRETKVQIKKEVEIKIDTRTITKKLLHLLVANNRRKVGWNHSDLCLNPKLEEGGKTVVQLNKEAEKNQLYVETTMLRTYHALTWNWKPKVKGKRNSNFIRRKAKHAHHSLTYLIQQAWGIRSRRTYLEQLRTELVCDAVGWGVFDITANICVSFGDEEEYSNVRTVNDS